MTNRHQQSVDLAFEAQDHLKTLYSSVGSRVNQGGTITAAYRKMRAAIPETVTAVPEARSILTSFYTETTQAVKDAIYTAGDMGMDLAEQQSALYGLRPPASRHGIIRIRDKDNAVETVSQIVRGQVNYANLQLNIGARDKERLVGSDDQPGQITPYTVIKALGWWLPAIFWLAYDTWVDWANRDLQNPFNLMKQAVAVLDGKTTETCFGVHGQVVGMREDFILGGEFPGSAPYPPFHNWCRTTVALILAEDAEDGLTEAMLALAIAVALEKGQKG